MLRFAVAATLLATLTLSAAQTCYNPGRTISSSTPRSSDSDMFCCSDDSICLSNRLLSQRPSAAIPTLSRVLHGFRMRGFLCLLLYKLPHRDERPNHQRRSELRRPRDLLLW
ncbi:hypothetical protein BDV12DRAFT_178912 [Aspergillus spectabilis]